mmetsp:Transcript_8112/g.23042  ORF Transcript_8112/g.23042 Transcript_8112/m.23042 type:complete len:258 (-) Transcript_8112:28-801(-)
MPLHSRPSPSRRPCSQPASRTQLLRASCLAFPCFQQHSLSLECPEPPPSNLGPCQPSCHPQPFTPTWLLNPFSSRRPRPSRCLPPVLALLEERPEQPQRLCSTSLRRHRTHRPPPRRSQELMALPQMIRQCQLPLPLLPFPNLLLLPTVPSHHRSRLPLQLQAFLRRPPPTERWGGASRALQQQLSEDGRTGMRGGGARKSETVPTAPGTLEEARSPSRSHTTTTGSIRGAHGGGGFLVFGCVSARDREKCGRAGSG